MFTWFHGRYRVVRTLALAAGGVATLAAAPLFTSCDIEPASSRASLLVAPSSTPTSPVLTIPETELATVVLLDATTSADRFAEEAKAIVSDRLASWFIPGHGGLELHLNRITSDSYDASNELFSAAIPGLPEEPVLRPTLQHPAGPDFASCKKNAFGRAACEAELTNNYNLALHEALADEEAAAVELDEATALFEELHASRLAEAEQVAEQLRSLDPGSDDRGTDLDGAFLRAAEILQASHAPKKLVIVQSDMLPWGHQSTGTLDLTNVIVLVWFYDCREDDCGARKAMWTERFTAAGALSVQWLDPASSRVLTDLFGGVL